jgi:hypothetical protein
MAVRATLTPSNWSDYERRNFPNRYRDINQNVRNSTTGDEQVFIIYLNHPVLIQELIGYQFATSTCTVVLQRVLFSELQIKNKYILR